MEKSESKRSKYMVNLEIQNDNIYKTTVKSGSLHIYYTY